MQADLRKCAPAALFLLLITSLSVSEHRENFRRAQTRRRCLIPSSDKQTHREPCPLSGFWPSFPALPFLTFCISNTQMRADIHSSAGVGSTLRTLHDQSENIQQRSKIFSQTHKCVWSPRVSSSGLLKGESRGPRHILYGEGPIPADRRTP